ncbi:MAG TPA: DUF4091 domain-containing protein [Armatimonadetes bacterium]|nr:DUF4091 domain-containing protein [Armatimonadota bacterium]
MMVKHCAALLFFLSIVGAGADAWHHPLYLGNGELWRQRIPVTLRNEMDREAAGDPVSVSVGKGHGEADLAGVPVSQIRVCNARGQEMLFAVSGPTGALITRGPVPAGGTLSLPAECPARGTAKYYIYFDNPTAWDVPDFLSAAVGVRNGSVEEGTGNTPAHWDHDPQDPLHQLFWTTENPRSGKRCLKTVVSEGAEPTWIATRQRGIHLVGGAKYVMRAWVKAQNVRGFAGWYIHVGNSQNPMILSPMLRGGEGTYDWREVTAEFTAPEEANRATLGTVLRGTGTAWFDDVTLECAEKPRLLARASKPERLSLRRIGASAKWFDENPRDDITWSHRVPIRVRNFSGDARDAHLVYVDLSGLMARLRGKMRPEAIRVTDGDRVVAHYPLGEGLLVEAGVPAQSERTYYLYLSTDLRIQPGTTAGYDALLESPRNLARNASFEKGTALPDEWPGGAEGERPAGTEMGLDEGGLFGKRCARLHIPHDAKLAWTGWRQDVPVKPGRTYLYAAWLKTRDIRNGSVQLHAHYRNMAGEHCESQKFAGTGPALTGTKEWTSLSGMFMMPEDIANFQLHLTMLASGTVWHDGVLLAEVTPGEVGALEARKATATTRLAVWPVNPLVKVFREDVPPPAPAPARVSAARNEKEPLQLAVRGPAALKGVRIEVTPPVHRTGARLPAPEVAVVGYVPIDHKTSYYSSNTPEWHRKYPTNAGASDGWAGMWPDPLFPRSVFDLEPNKTQPFWITVSVPQEAAPGDYTGEVRLIVGGKRIATVPFTVHVWSFTLPDEQHVAAVYDVRRGPMWTTPGKSADEERREFWKFMAERRLCPDKILPDPVIRYENGRVITDFTEYDKAAEYYFNVLKLPTSYMPSQFTLFGWGHPPAAKHGEKPYEGNYPYEGVDRRKLRPEYKRAYQACLKAYWEHVKAKGWHRKLVLYISDEPYYSRPEIIAQMQALCEMIREVDPEIPIYCSTWHHVPEWDGYLSLWGIGHYGIVKPEKIAELRQAGTRVRWTTDGQMCTDTPYCAVERLLPHYCFQYDVEAYEFWGIDWLTYDPYQFGWHRYIHQSGEPGQATWVRYPNGDGYLAYPGGLIGVEGPVTSVRLEQAREGVEDYEYLYLLRELVGKADPAAKGVSAAKKALAEARSLVTIPSAGGRYSTKILPDPDALLAVREAVARAIEGLAR